MPKKKAKKPLAEIKKTEGKLAKAGISRGRAGHTTRRVKRELRALGRRSPGFAPVKAHSALVKRAANELAKALQEKGFEIDRGLVNQAALAHDSRRDVKNHDLATKKFWAERGAPELARTIGDLLTLENYRAWPLEKKLLAWGDNVCRAVKRGKAIVNGTLPSKKAFRLLASQRQAFPGKIDDLVRERQAIVKFEKWLKRQGIDLDSILAKRLKKNPPGFEAEVEKDIDPNVDRILAASLKRLGLKKIE